MGQALGCGASEWRRLHCGEPPTRVIVPQGQMCFFKFHISNDMIFQRNRDLIIRIWVENGIVARIATAKAELLPSERKVWQTESHCSCPNIQCDHCFPNCRNKLGGVCSTCNIYDPEYRHVTHHVKRGAITTSDLNKIGKVDHHGNLVHIHQIGECFGIRLTAVDDELQAGDYYLTIEAYKYEKPKQELSTRNRLVAIDEMKLREEREKQQGKLKKRKKVPLNTAATPGNLSTSTPIVPSSGISSSSSSSSPLLNSSQMNSSIPNATTAAKAASFGSGTIDLGSVGNATDEMKSVHAISASQASLTHYQQLLLSRENSLTFLPGADLNASRILLNEDDGSPVVLLVAIDEWNQIGDPKNGNELKKTVSFERNEEKQIEIVRSPKKVTTPGSARRPKQFSSLPAASVASLRSSSQTVSIDAVNLNDEENKNEEISLGPRILSGNVVPSDEWNDAKQDALSLAAKPTIVDMKQGEFEL